MISLLPVICALGLLVSPGTAHPSTINRALSRAQPAHNSILKTSGPVHTNLTTGAGTASANASVDKRGTKWGKYVSYSGDKFMDESLWDYWTKDDPTHGKVK